MKKFNGLTKGEISRVERYIKKRDNNKSYIGSYSTFQSDVSKELNSLTVIFDIYNKETDEEMHNVYMIILLDDRRYSSIWKEVSATDCELSLK